jgi:hypothetical protein
MGFGGSGGGSSRIATSLDVALNNPLNSEVLTYDQTVSKWKNSVITGSQTVHSLPGVAVVPVTSDTFSTGNVANIDGRLSDALAGGSPVAWTTSTSSWGITNSKLSSQSLAAGFAGLEQQNSDYEIVATLLNLNGDGGTAESRRFCLRRQDGTSNSAPTEYRVSIKSTGQYIIAKSVDGTSTSLYVSANNIIKSGDTIGFKIVNKTIIFSLNGKPLTSLVDSNSPITAPGYAGFSKTAGVIDFTLGSVAILPVLPAATNVFEAKNYGVIGDGINDDAPALKEVALMASAISVNTTAGVVKLDASSTVLLASLFELYSSVSNVTIDGQGAKIVKGTSSDVTSLIRLSGTVNVKLINMTFDFGSEPNLTALSSITLRNTQKTHIEECTFINPTWAIRIETTDPNTTKDIYIAKNYFGEVVDFAIVAPPDSNDTIPINVQVISNRVRTVSNGSIYAMSPSAIYGHFTKSLFAFNRVEDSYDTGIMLTAGTDNRIIGNYLYTQMVGIYLGGPVLKTSGGVTTDTGKDALRRTTVIGNNVTSVTDYGIHQLCRPYPDWNKSTIADLVVTGNNVSNCGKAGIATQGASYVNFSNNVVTNCGLREVVPNNSSNDQYAESSGILITGYGKRIPEQGEPANKYDDDVARYSQHIMIANNTVRNDTGKNANFGIRVSSMGINPEAIVVSNNDVSGAFTVSKHSITTDIGSDSFIQTGNYTRDLRAYTSTANRTSASAAGKGAEYFDATINKKLWSDGVNWLTSSGTIVPDA